MVKFPLSVIIVTQVGVCLVWLLMLPSFCVFLQLGSMKLWTQRKWKAFCMFPICFSSSSFLVTVTYSLCSLYFLSINPFNYYHLSHLSICCFFYIRDGMYVRAHGHLKGFQGKRNLNAFSVRYKLIYYFLKFWSVLGPFEIGTFFVLELKFFYCISLSSWAPHFLSLLFFNLFCLWSLNSLVLCDGFMILVRKFQIEYFSLLSW